MRVVATSGTCLISSVGQRSRSLGCADGRFDDKKLDAIAVKIAASIGRISLQSEVAEYAVTATAWAASWDHVEQTAEAAAVSAGLARSPHRWKRPRNEEKKWQSWALRDIFRNPFRPLLDGVGVEGKASIVKALAQSIYTDRTFDRLPILADELVKSGCAVPEILSHLRGPGPHARGCWAWI